MIIENHLTQIVGGALAIFIALVSVIYRSMDSRIAVIETSKESLLKIAIETRADVKHIRQHCAMCQFADNRPEGE